MYFDPYKSDLDKGFSQDDIKVLMKCKLPPPSQISEQNGELDFETYQKSIGHMRQKIALQKSRINRSESPINNK